MENIEFLLSFFGWCSVINIAVLVFATVFLALFGDFAKNIHSKIFNIPKDKLDVIYFKYLAYNQRVRLFELHRSRRIPFHCWFGYFIWLLSKRMGTTGLCQNQSSIIWFYANKAREFYCLKMENRNERTQRIY